MSEDAPGLALTFDDAYVQEWFNALPVFARYDVKATFYICYIRRLVLQQVNLIHGLARMGHEVGFHSDNHLNAVTTSNEIGVDAYMERDVLPGLGTMRDYGFTPRAWAYPYNKRNAATDAALAPHFSTMRTYAETLEAGLHPFSGNKLIFGRPLDLFKADGAPLRPVEEVLGWIDATPPGRVLALYAHGISDVPTHHNYLSWAALEVVLEHAVSRGMRFVTASEIA